MSLKDYEIGKELGSGAFGSVAIVKRKEDGQTYAMKRVKITRLDKKERENAINEIRLLASLHHPNIIGYFEAFYDEPSTTLNIIMEYADDGDIAAKIKEIKRNRVYLEEKTIWNWFIQLLNGLKYLHDSKIMHRDIKCANIFLTKEGVLKLGDLNVSKLTDLKMASTTTGTPFYMAPEVWDGKAYNFTCDIWSLGCIIYELAKQRPPFNGTSLKELYKNIKKGQYEGLPSYYSDKLKDIISKMLVTNPKYRMGCADLLKLDIIWQKNKELNIDYLYNNQTIPNFNLMQTIKIPKVMSDINKSLPKKHIGNKKKARKEMMQNDEYETSKSHFFSTMKKEQQVKQNKEKERNKEENKIEKIIEEEPPKEQKNDGIKLKRKIPQNNPNEHPKQLIRYKSENIDNKHHSNNVINNYPCHQPAPQADKNSAIKQDSQKTIIFKKEQVPCQPQPALPKIESTNNELPFNHNMNKPRAEELQRCANKMRQDEEELQKKKQQIDKHKKEIKIYDKVEKKHPLIRVPNIISDKKDKQIVFKRKDSEYQYILGQFIQYRKDNLYPHQQNKKKIICYQKLGYERKAHDKYQIYQIPMNKQIGGGKGPVIIRKPEEKPKSNPPDKKIVVCHPDNKHHMGHPIIKREGGNNKK